MFSQFNIDDEKVFFFFCFLVFYFIIWPDLCLPEFLSLPPSSSSLNIKRGKVFAFRNLDKPIKMGKFWYNSPGLEFLHLNMLKWYVESWMCFRRNRIDVKISKVSWVLIVNLKKLVLIFW